MQKQANTNHHTVVKLPKNNTKAIKLAPLHTKMYADYDWKEIQLTLIRIYIGLDFIHHFAEKFGLLGDQAYQGVLHYFSTVTSNPAPMVLLAGLCEFGAFVGFTFGLFTRVAAIGTAFYLLIAMLMGNHQAMGFTWANPGGGWEFPALWAFICLSYVLTGGGRYSLDHLLRQSLPTRLRFLCR